MVRICAHITKNNRRIKDNLFEFDGDFEIGKFESYIEQISYAFDIPNPITLVTHIKNFIMFNHCIYKPDDFVDKVNFDKLVIENAKI